MNSLKRAFRYFTRKKIHSILMILTLSAILILILTVFSATVTADFYINQMKENFSKNFTIAAHKSPGILTPENITSIAESNNITSYTCISNTLAARFLDRTGSALNISTNGDNLVSPGFEHAGTLISNMSSDDDELFVDGTLELIAGRHLEKNEKYKVLVHQELAESNNMQIGDKMQLDFPEEIIADLSRHYDTEYMVLDSITVEIIGVFQTKQSADAINGLQLSHQRYENYCYIDINTYSAFFNLENTIFFHKVLFSISTAAELEEVISNLQSIDWIDWSSCNIWSDLNEYGSTIDALRSLDKLLRMGLLLIVLISFLILTFMIFYGVKRRKKEIGILLAVGVSPNAIILQHIAEAFLSTIAAIILAIIISRGIVENSNHYLLNTVINQNKEEHEATTASSKNTEMNTRLSLSFTTVRKVAFLEIILVVVSVITVSVPLVRKQPSELIRTSN